MQAVNAPASVRCPDHPPTDQWSAWPTHDPHPGPETADPDRAVLDFTHCPEGRYGMVAQVRCL